MNNSSITLQTRKGVTCRLYHMPPLLSRGLRQDRSDHFVASQGAELSIVGLHHGVFTVRPCAWTCDDTFVPFEDVEPPMLRILATDALTLTNLLAKCYVTHNQFPFKLFSILRRSTVDFSPRLFSTTTPSLRILRTLPYLVLLPIPTTGFIVTSWSSLLVMFQV